MDDGILTGTYIDIDGNIISLNMLPSTKLPGEKLYLIDIESEYYFPATTILNNPQLKEIGEAIFESLKKQGNNINAINIIEHKTNDRIVYLKLSSTKQKQKHRQPNPSIGMFIHWGVYSVPAFTPIRKTIPNSGTLNGSEWYLDRITAPVRIHKKSTVEYHNSLYPDDIDDNSLIASKNRRNRYYGDFLNEFNEISKSTDMDNWMNIAKSIGATYVIFTVKHHDGVSLYPSKYGLYHTSSDHVKNFVDSAKKHGLKVGLYYSLLEFTDLYSSGSKKIVDLNYIDGVMIPQIFEIMDRYNPDIFWTDGDWQHDIEIFKSREIIRSLRERSPKIILNDRWGKNRDELFDEFPDLTFTGKDRTMTGNGKQNWEHVNTIGLSWGYASNQRDSDYKSAMEIGYLIKSIIGKGGKFVLNIGPKPDGTLDTREKRKLDYLLKSKSS